MKIPGGTSTDFQMPEPGTYLARCIKSIDLGTHTGEYQGTPYSRHQVMIVWELPDELIETGELAGQPFTVAKFYTASTHQKANLHHDLMSWFPTRLTPEKLEEDGFDTAQLIGIPCQVTLAATDSGKRKVMSVTAPPKGVKVAPQVNPSVVFDLDAFDSEVYEGLSEKIRALIAESPEYQAVMKQYQAVMQQPGVFADLSEDDFQIDDPGESFADLPSAEEFAEGTEIAEEAYVKAIMDSALPTERKTSMIDLMRGNRDLANKTGRPDDYLVWLKTQTARIPVAS